MEPSGIVDGARCGDILKRVGFIGFEIFGWVSDSTGQREYTEV